MKKHKIVNQIYNLEKNSLNNFEVSENFKMKYIISKIAKFVDQQTVGSEEGQHSSKHSVEDIKTSKFNEHT